MPILFRDNKRPEMNIEVNGKTYTHDISDMTMQLFSVMLFPNDHEKQSVFVDSTRAHVLIRLSDIFGDKIFFSSRELSYVHRTPAFPALVDAAKQSHQYGTVASEILTTVISISKHEDIANHASIGTVIRAMSYARRGERGFSFENIKKNMWQPYKSVSHLWAAMYMARSHIRDDEFCTSEGLGTMLALSEAIRAIGEAWRPLRAEEGDTILNSRNAWRPPDGMISPKDINLIDAELTWHRPPDQMLRDAKIIN